nr:YjjW family glycine radical enzyme activase [Anaerosporobacter faecicola]
MQGIGYNTNINGDLVVNTAIVNKIIRFSSVDGPGNRTVVFLQGCNFNCRYCHNPETIGACKNCGTCVSYCKTGALTMVEGKVLYNPERCVNCDSCFHHCPHGSSPKTRSMTPEEVFAEVKKNIPFIRGITVSGGECTLWRDFLVELLRLARQTNLSTMLDSNGTYDFIEDPELLDVVDGVMLDVKAFDGVEHTKITGKQNDLVLKNLRELAKRDKLFEVRTVAVPELFDVAQTVKQTSKILQELGKAGQVRYKLIRFRPIGVREQYQNYQAPDDTFMEQLQTVARGHGITDIVII